MPQSPLEKNKVLERLSLLHDEPDRESKLFQFDKFAKQLANIILDEKLHTPYAIAVHGEWGEGKTSLIGHAHNLLISAVKEQNKDWKVLWFDAWEYERLDPVAALLQRISNLYAEGERNQKFREAINGLASIFSDVVLRSAIHMTLKEAREHFESSIEQIPTISEKLSKMIGEGRLIVFVDDLDRCHVDNALGIMDAIKLFLHAEGAIFVVAVDMKKLERAWDLRYKGYEIAKMEGKDHADKIFQLKLSLPPKEAEAIKEYVRWLATSLPPDLSQLIAEGCPPNLRKIKRILNLIYFLSKGTPEEGFDKVFPLIVIWSIVTVAYPELARIISANPNSLIMTIDYFESKRYHDAANRTYHDHLWLTSQNFDIREEESGISYLVSSILKVAQKDVNIYNFLLSITRYSEKEKHRPIPLYLKDEWLTPESFRDIIFRAGLVG
jgi:hypothetical protein